MTIRLQNVVSIADTLAARLWRDLEHLRADDPLRAAVGTHADTVERLCRRAGGGPADLPPRTRNAYVWLRYLSGRDHWVQHLAALRRLREALAPLPAPVGAAEVHLVAMDALWRIRGIDPRRRVPLLRLHQGFMAAEDGFLTAFAGAWARRDMASLGRLGRDFSLTGGFLEVANQLQALTPATGDAGRGRVHDLEASFHRVNDAHFDGALERPTLRWGAKSAVRTHGSYRFAEDRLTISPALDAEGVPAWVVDFVVFHELLHKSLGLTVQGSRRYAHTAAFRLRERAHPDFLEAERFLQGLARRSGGRRQKARRRRGSRA